MPRGTVEAFDPARLYGRQLGHPRKTRLRGNRDTAELPRLHLWQDTDRSVKRELYLPGNLVDQRRRLSFIRHVHDVSVPVMDLNISMSIGGLVPFPVDA